MQNERLPLSKSRFITIFEDVDLDVGRGGFSKYVLHMPYTLTHFLTHFYFVNYFIK